MTSTIKVDTIQDSGGNTIISSDGSGTITQTASIGSFSSTGIDDNASSTAITINSSNLVGIGTSSPSTPLHISTSAENVATFASTDTAARIVITDGTDTGYVNVSNDSGTGVISIGQTLGLSPNNLNVDDSGNVGIGTSSPSEKLEINTGTLLFSGSIDQNTDSDIALPGNSVIRSQSDLQFVAGDSSGADEIIFYRATSGTNVDGKTGATESMRIDSSGNVLVGTTNTDPGFNNVVGQSFAGTGQIQVTRDGGTGLLVNRKTSEGELVSFRKDGATVGSIGSSFSTAYYTGTNSGIRFGNNGFPTNGSGANNDNAVDLGISSVRWKDFYLAGNIYLGGTGSANALDDYEEGTFTPAIEGTTTAGTFTPNGSYTRGRYTKVGRLVNIYFALVYSSFTGTGNIRLTGLPFATENTYMQLPVTVIPVNMTKPTDSIVHGEINANSTTIRLFTFSTTSSSRPALSVDPAAEIYISATYHTG